MNLWTVVVLMSVQDVQTNGGSDSSLLFLLSNGRGCPAIKFNM